jgi:hypothetical protein
MTGATTDRPPETRLWVALQRLGRLRDEYTRDRCPTGRLATARAMADRVAELRTLADEVLADAERAAG